jgi:hypothetical protein
MINNIIPLIFMVIMAGVGLQAIRTKNVKLRSMTLTGNSAQWCGVFILIMVIIFMISVYK